VKKKPKQSPVTVQAPERAAFIGMRVTPELARDLRGIARLRGCTLTALVESVLVAFLRGDKKRGRK